jgi:hypothetical protein
MPLSACTPASSRWRSGEISIGSGLMRRILRTFRTSAGDSMDPT